MTDARDFVLGLFREYALGGGISREKALDAQKRLSNEIVRAKVTNCPKETIEALTSLRNDVVGLKSLAYDN